MKSTKKERHFSIENHRKNEGKNRTTRVESTDKGRIRIHHMQSQVTFSCKFGKTFVKAVRSQKVGSCNHARATCERSSLDHAQRQVAKGTYRRVVALEVRWQRYDATRRWHDDCVPVAHVRADAARLHRSERVLVDDRGVIGLAGVLHHELPVAVDGVVRAASRDHPVCSTAALQPRAISQKKA